MNSQIDTSELDGALRDLGVNWAAAVSGPYRKDLEAAWARVHETVRSLVAREAERLVREAGPDVPDGDRAVLDSLPRMKRRLRVVRDQEIGPILQAWVRNENLQGWHWDWIQTLTVAEADAWEAALAGRSTEDVSVPAESAPERVLVAHGKEVEQIPVWPHEALGCGEPGGRSCGFTPAGIGMTCREGDACGRYLHPGDPGHAEVSAYYRDVCAGAAPRSVETSDGSPD